MPVVLAVLVLIAGILSAELGRQHVAPPGEDIPPEQTPVPGPG